MIVHVEVAFANIGRGAKGEQVKANVSRFLDAVSARKVLGAFAEIDEGNPGVNEHDVLRHLDHHAIHLRSMATREPLFHGHVWSMPTIEHENGMAGVAHQSPPRDVTDALCRHQVGAELGLITWHGPTHAYNGPDHVAAREVLKAGWDNCQTIDDRRADAHLAAGRPVIRVGDKNRHRMPMRRTEISLFDAGPDHASLLLPQNVRMVGKSIHRVIPLNIDDHNGHAVRFSLEYDR